MLDIADLKSQRADISARLSEIFAARARLQSAEGEEAAILAEIGALGASEIEALAVWARSNEGDKPTPDAAARAALNERLVAAQLAAEQARAAGVGLDADQLALSAQLQRVNGSIETFALDTMSKEREAALADFLDFIETSVKPRLARLLSLHGFLIEKGQRLQSSGGVEAARPLFVRAEALKIASIEAMPLAGQIIADQAYWGARFAELTRGTPSNVVPLQQGAA